MKNCSIAAHEKCSP